MPFTGRIERIATAVVKSGAATDDIVQADALAVRWDRPIEATLRGGWPGVIVDKKRRADRRACVKTGGVPGREWRAGMWVTTPQGLAPTTSWYRPRPRR